MIHYLHLTARIRECWIAADNLRVSGDYPEWTDRPTIYSIVVEYVEVEKPHRGHGECRAFLEQFKEDKRFDMVVVEGVQNPILADALLRWGWEVDRGVMDFYWRKENKDGLLR